MLYINRIIQYIFFGKCFFHLTYVFEIHSCGHVVKQYKWAPLYPLLCSISLRGSPQFLCSDGGHLDCSQFGAIMNNAADNEYCFVLCSPPPPKCHGMRVPTVVQWVKNAPAVLRRAAEAWVWSLAGTVGYGSLVAVAVVQVITAAPIQFPGLGNYKCHECGHLKTKRSSCYGSASWEPNIVSMRMWVQSPDLLSGLRIWCCCRLWGRSQMQFRFGIAVTVVQDSSWSSDSAPSLGTSICLTCIWKRKKKKCHGMHPSMSTYTLTSFFS